MESLPALPPLSNPASPPALQLRSAPGSEVSPLRRAAEEYEALFLAEMLAPIFETVETDGPFGGGSAERIYRSLMVQEYGKALAGAGGVGIADAVERELLKLQETQA